MNGSQLFMRWDLAGVVAAISALATVLVWFGRVLMLRNFVSHADYEKMSGRLHRVEVQLEKVATKVELKALEDRVRPVETGVAVLGEKVEGVKRTTDRIEHIVTILMENQMRRESPSDHAG